MPRKCSRAAAVFPNFPSHKGRNRPRKELINIILEIIRLAVSLMLHMAVLALATLAVALLGVALYVVSMAIAESIKQSIKKRKRRA